MKAKIDYSDGLTLEKQHNIESRLGRDLTDLEVKEIGDYIDDDPCSTDTAYLIDIFDL